MGWKNLFPRLSQNELGFKGHKATGTPVATVLLLGDSQAASMTHVDHMPEIYLQRALTRRTASEIRVVTIAEGGWGTDQELLALEESFTQIEPRPRLVVLWFTPRNDLWNNLFPTHFPRNGPPKPTFWLENGDLRGPNAAWMKPYHRSDVYLIRLWDQLNGRSVHPLDEEWEERLPPAYRNAAKPVDAMPSLKAYMASKRGVKEEWVPFWWGENFDSEKNHYSVFLTPPSPRMRYAVELTRALLRRMAEFCRRNGAELYAFYREETSLFPDAPTDFAADGKVVTLSLQTERELMRQVFDGIPHEVIPVSAPDLLRPGDDHLNEKGNELIMERVAERVQAHFPDALRR